MPTERAMKAADKLDALAERMTQVKVPQHQGYISKQDAADEISAIAAELRGLCSPTMPTKDGRGPIRVAIRFTDADIEAINQQRPLSVAVPMRPPDGHVMLSTGEVVKLHGNIEESMTADRALLVGTEKCYQVDSTGYVQGIDVGHRNKRTDSSIPSEVYGPLGWFYSTREAAEAARAGKGVGDA